jgi:hypothetical protein
MTMVGRVLLVLMIILFSATGSTGRDYTARLALPEGSASEAEVPRPVPPIREVSKEKMLAWFLLMMKEGAGAR